MPTRRRQRLGEERFHLPFDPNSQWSLGDALLREMKAASTKKADCGSEILAVRTLPPRSPAYFFRGARAIQRRIPRGSNHSVGKESIRATRVSTVCLRRGVNKRRELTWALLQ